MIHLAIIIGPMSRLHMRKRLRRDQLGVQSGLSVENLGDWAVLLGSR